MIPRLIPILMVMAVLLAFGAHATERWDSALPVLVCTGIGLACARASQYMRVALAIGRAVATGFLCVLGFILMDKYEPLLPFVGTLMLVCFVWNKPEK